MYILPPQKGALSCILDLIDNCKPKTNENEDRSMMMDYLSCLYTNVACGESRRYQAVMAGLVPRLIYLCDASPSLKYVRLCRLIYFSCSFSFLVIENFLEEEEEGRFVYIFPLLFHLKKM